MNKEIARVVFFAIRAIYMHLPQRLAEFIFNRRPAS